MGSLLDKVMGGSSTRSLDDYVPIDFNDEGIDASSNEVAGVQLHVARIANNQDLLDVKDAVYAGDIVVTAVAPDGGLTAERIEEKLSEVATDVQGDIVRKDNGELIIVPAGVHIPREPIGR